MPLPDTLYRMDLSHRQMYFESLDDFNSFKAEVAAAEAVELTKEQYLTETDRNKIAIVPQEEEKPSA